MPPVIYVGHITGDTLPAADWNSNWQLVEAGALDLGGFVITGLVPTIGTGLSVNVSAGTALIGAHLAPAGFSIAGLADNTTNHLYLNQNGTGASNTSGTQPAATAKLGTCVTLAGAVTSVNTNRSSGRQAYIRPELRVPGGPGAGNPPSISLAAAAAAAADGVTLFGVLPAASLPADVAFIDVGNVFSVTQVVTPSSTSRCLTLNHKNGVGATVFLVSNNAIDATWRTLINFGSKFQFGTDSAFNGTADWFLQNQTTGNLVLLVSAADLLTLGTAAAGATVPGALTVSGHLVLTGGSTPAAAAGANAGTTPPAPVVAAGANDKRGSLTWGTGTGAAPGAQIAVTFNTTFAGAPVVMIVPKNDATAALSLYVTGNATTGFTISAHGTPTSSQANTVFAADYLCAG